MSPRILEGRKALVTGASRGIGRAIAEALAREGLRVAVHFNRHREGAESLVDSLDGGPHKALQGDLSQAGEGRRLVAAAVEALGGIDFVVNNAGIYEPHLPATATAAAWDEAWESILAVNLRAPAEICHSAIEPLRAAGGGRIVNISSRGAFRGEPEAPAYGASKAGLNSLSQSLAKALAPEGIFVFTIAPGWVDTDMAAPHVKGEGGAEILGQIPLGRLAAPEEIARAVVFFASPGVESMTGCVLDVNGASYLRT